MRAGLRLVVIVPYPLRRAPGQRFRFEQYLDTWRDAGIEVDVRPLFGTVEMGVLYRPGNVPRKIALVLRAAGRRLGDLVRARRYDVAFVYREAFPLGYPIVERLLPKLGVPYIFDLDDAIWLPSSTDANRAFQWLKMPDKAGVIARHAALVTAGNEHIAEWARAYTDRVMVVPTTIDTERYRPAPTRDYGRTIGWSGSATTIQHLRTVERVLAEVQRDHDVNLRVIGDPTYELDGAEIDVRPWQEETELHDLAELDIGVMPLPDDEWSRGKCGLKALQYMALGIPTMMSPVGVNRAIAEDGAAVLAGDHDEWRRLLVELLNDPARRAELGRLGRQRVEERYSQRAIAPLWVEAVRRAAGR